LYIDGFCSYVADESILTITTTPISSHILIHCCTHHPHANIAITVAPIHVITKSNHIEKNIFDLHCSCVNHTHCIRFFENSNTYQTNQNTNAAIVANNTPT
jgi:hypothetical protein